MLEEERDHVLARLVVPLLEAELGEALVLPDEVRGRRLDDRQDALERVPVEGVLQVLDRFELDAAFSEDVDGAPRVSSTGVVVDGDALVRHAVLLPRGSRRVEPFC